MFEIGDIVKLNEWNDVKTLNNFNYQPYTIKKYIMMPAIYHDSYEIVGTIDKTELLVHGYKLSLDEHYYRKQKIQQLCSKLEKR